MIPEVDDLINQAVTEVFDKMLSLKVQTQPPETALANGETHVAGSVGFIGALTGVVYIYTTVSFARRITGIMLGLSETEIEAEDMVNDAMGEMTNMITGHLKSTLSDRGLPCVLTIPSIVRGSHFTVEAVSSTHRRVSSFRCDTSHLLVEVLFKPTD